MKPKTRRRSRSPHPLVVTALLLGAVGSPLAAIVAGQATPGTVDERR